MLFKKGNRIYIQRNTKFTESKSLPGTFKQFHPSKDIVSSLRNPRIEPLALLYKRDNICQAKLRIVARQTRRQHSNTINWEEIAVS